MTWLPWLGAMVLALLVFAANGWYQHRTWWRKGGNETHFLELDVHTSMPSMTGHAELGGSFQVRVGHVGYDWLLLCSSNLVVRVVCTLLSLRRLSSCPAI